MKTLQLTKAQARLLFDALSAQIDTLEDEINETTYKNEIEEYTKDQKSLANLQRKVEKCL